MAFYCYEHYVWSFVHKETPCKCRSSIKSESTEYSCIYNRSSTSQPRISCRYVNRSSRQTRFFFLFQQYSSEKLEIHLSRSRYFSSPFNHRFKELLSESHLKCISLKNGNGMNCISYFSRIFKTTWHKDTLDLVKTRAYLAIIIYFSSIFLNGD